MTDRPINLPPDLTIDEARALVERLVLIAGEPGCHFVPYPQRGTGEFSSARRIYCERHGEVRDLEARS